MLSRVLLLENMTNPDQSRPQPARWLELSERTDGSVVFTIKPDTKGQDVITTLAYLQPEQQKREEYVIRLLHAAIDEGVFRHRWVSIDEPGVALSDQVHLGRFIHFGDDPTIEDVVGSVEHVYGEAQVAEKLQTLFIELVDEGVFSNFIVCATQSNEIALAQPNEIALEMQQLTDEFFGNGT